MRGGEQARRAWSALRGHPRHLVQAARGWERARLASERVRVALREHPRRVVRAARGWERARLAGERVRIALREHPRHLVLAALVAGLLLAPLGAVSVVPAAAAAAALGGRSLVALLAAAAVLGGAAFAAARLSALDAGVLAHMHGRSLSSRAVLLEPPRERGFGRAAARARLLDGPGAGEQAVLRFRAGPLPAPGANAGVAGREGGGAGATAARGATWAPRGAGAAGRDVGGAGRDVGGAGRDVGGAGRDGGGAGHSGEAWPGVGEIVAVTGTVGPLGLADAYQRRRNAHAAIDATRVQPTGTRRGGAAGVLDAIRGRAEAGLAGGLAPPEAALLRGMVLGEDEQLGDDVREDFQRSGLAHILAVSGSNVMLLAALILGACALAGVPLRARLLLAVAVIALYVPLAGGGPSIQRAGVMGVAGLVAALAGRPGRRWYALLLAAAVTLAVNPRAAGEPGWQLSFAAVAALLVGAPPLRAVFARRMPRALAEAAAITVAATLGTAPLMALYFQQVSLASLPANLLAAPAIAPIMWLGVLAATAAQIAAPAAAPFAVVAAPLLVYVEKVAHVAAATPGSVIDLRLSPFAILAGWAALAAVTGAALRRWGRSVLGEPPIPIRWRRIAPAVAVVTALLVVVHVAGARTPRPAPGELVVSFLDIGQGDATLVQLGRTSVLVDTGPPDGPILKRLKEAGVRRLDALMTTHAEADHEGAAPAVIAAFHPRLVVDGGAGWPSRVQRVLARTRVHAPQAGEVITLGGLTFRVLWPPPRRPGWTAGGDPNDSALVTRLEANGLSLLLTADAESPVLAPLALAPVDVLKVSHHGSVDPGLPSLLARLRPRIAAIEVGRHNTYGHPAPSTLATLKAAVPTIVRTDRDGTTRLHVLHGRVWLERGAGR